MTRLRLVHDGHLHPGQVNTTPPGPRVAFERAQFPGFALLVPGSHNAPPRKPELDPGWGDQRQWRPRAVDEQISFIEVWITTTPTMNQYVALPIHRPDQSDVQGAIRRLLGRVPAAAAAPR